MKKQQKSIEKRGKNFTLIELLVVLAVIAILAALLLPALSKARERAQSAICVGQLKDLGLSMNFYSGDYNDFMPAVWRVADTSDSWPWVLRRNKYVQTAKQYFCPAVARYTTYYESVPNYAATLDLPNNHTPGNAWRFSKISYGYNPIIGSMDYWGGIGSLVKNTSTKNPASKYLIADAFNTVSIRGVIRVNPYYNAYAHFHARHLNACNITWADGHVTAVSKPISELQNNYTSSSNANNRIRYYFYPDYNGDRD